MSSLHDILHEAVNPALELLPQAMDSDRAKVLLLAICLQESRGIHRDQLDSTGKPGNLGPAVSLWQFEKGTRDSRGGVWGVYLHSTSRFWLKELCKARQVNFHPLDIWTAMAKDDILAAGVARLLLFTDPKPLPYDSGAGWRYYIRNWRPGKPHPDTWVSFYMQAYDTVHPRSAE
jgi:hypothetical protein